MAASAGLRTRIAGALALVLALLSSGCGSSASEESSGSSTTEVVTTFTDAPPSTTATTTTTEGPTTTAAPTTTVPPTTDDGTIEIIGDDEFVAHAEAALALLEERAPQWHAEVLESVDRIQFVEAGSGMDVFTRTFNVGRQTAYAPGYGVEDQVEWLAGAIVHDACHSEMYIEGRQYSGRDAELECLIEQAESLELHEEGTTFLVYVNGLIEGIDDPANAYWTDPNRHW